MTIEELAVLVALTVDCGCCAIDHEACRKVAEFVRSQYTDVELQDEEVLERIRVMMDDIYNYEVFTRSVSGRANQN